MSRRLSTLSSDRIARIGKGRFLIEDDLTRRGRPSSRLIFIKLDRVFNNACKNQAPLLQNNAAVTDLLQQGDTMGRQNEALGGAVKAQRLELGKFLQ